MSFYLFLPLFALLAARFSRSFRTDVILLVLLSAGSLLWRAHYHDFFEVQKVSTLPGTFCWFGAG